MVPPSTESPVAVRGSALGRVLDAIASTRRPDPASAIVEARRPDPREAMAAIERRVRELDADPPSSDAPIALRGSAVARAYEALRH